MNVIYVNGSYHSWTYERDCDLLSEMSKGRRGEFSLDVVVYDLNRISDTEVSITESSYRVTQDSVVQTGEGNLTDSIQRFSLLRFFEKCSAV